MAFNGSGVFNRVYNWVADAAANINITASRVDTEDSGFAAGLSNCICKDGQTTIMADIPFSNNKITGLKAGTALTDAPTMSQAQNSASKLLSTVAGTGNVITATTVPVIAAYASGQTFRFVAANTNTTNVTINIAGIGAKEIKKLGVALVAGDITSGDTVEIMYDGTYFQMVSPARTGVFTDDSIPVAKLNGLLSALEFLYPVGTIYTNKTDSTNPATLFGFGVWTAITAKMIIGVDGWTYTAGSTGGSRTTTQSTLTMAVHNHIANVITSTVGPNVGALGDSSTSGSVDCTNPTASTGSGGAMTTISPYIAAYMWERTS